MSKLRVMPVRRILSDNRVPLLFIVLIGLALPYSGYSSTYLVQELLTRLARNSCLVLSLLVPIMAGMGLNFGMVLGAMAGQVSLILISDWGLSGLPGLGGAMLLTIPLAGSVGWLTGRVLNQAKGREMVTSFILAFFANGVYQLLVLYGMGSIIPIKNKALVLSRGYGIRNAVDLGSIRKALDGLVNVRLSAVPVPIATFGLIALLCYLLHWFRKTKLGHDMRAVGQDMAVATSAGITVDNVRIKAIIISTVLAGLGQIVYLQNIGTMNTYNSHEQIGMFSIAALLVGGASVVRASIANVFIGVTLFHLMFIVSPVAGKTILGSAMLGEYFRVFISYGVISVALVMYAVQRRSALRRQTLELDLVGYANAPSPQGDAVKTEPR